MFQFNRETSETQVFSLSFLKLTEVNFTLNTSSIKNFDELPENARHYIEFLEKEVGCPFKLISNGPRRDEIIYR